MWVDTSVENVGICTSFFCCAHSTPHSIIAGNHDLTLHEPWYETSFYRWHQSKEVRLLSTLHVAQYLSHKLQNTTAIRDLVSGEAARRAGVVYLEGETYDFRTHDDGRIWTVYGSPVRT